MPKPIKSAGTANFYLFRFQEKEVIHPATVKHQSPDTGQEIKETYILGWLPRHFIRDINGANEFYWNIPEFTQIYQNLPKLT